MFESDPFVHMNTKADELLKSNEVLFAAASKFDSAMYRIDDELRRFDERLNQLYYTMDQIRDELRDMSSLDKSLLEIGWDIAKVENHDRVFEKSKTPAHTIALFLKNLISFEGMLKVLAEKHSYSNFQLIEITKKLNEYLPKERRIEER